MLLDIDQVFLLQTNPKLEGEDSIPLYFGVKGSGVTMKTELKEVRHSFIY